MGSKRDSPLEKALVRDATSEDASALASIKQNETLHLDRIRDADGDALRYLVVEIDGQAVGFGCLVLGRPQNWPEMKHLPQMIDLRIREDLRCRGLGTLLIGEMEKAAKEAGHSEMRVGVDPENNARALSLYRRLGYTPIDPKPVEDRWEFVDSDGVRHAGVELLIHMKKPLA